MAIRIGSNISSLTAQRQLANSTSSLSTVFERLSSGSRINKAADDAAGLAIAETLNAKSRVYTRGVQNINDGISVVSIADAAIGALSDITTRIVELAEQSANGTYTNQIHSEMLWMKKLKLLQKSILEYLAALPLTASISSMEVYRDFLSRQVRVQTRFSRLS